MRQLIDHIEIYTASHPLQVISHGAILVDETQIGAIIDKDREPERYQWALSQADVRVDGGNMLAMPGLVNAHTHLFQTFMRGLGEGLPLYEWIQRMVWPIATAMGPDDFYYAALLGCLEAIKGGTTTLVDNHYVNCDPSNSDRVCQAMRDSGIRGVLARGYANTYYDPKIMEPDSVIHEELARLVRTWHGAAQGRIHVCPGPCSPVRCTPELLRWTGYFAKEHDLMIHIHTAETATIRHETLRDYGLSNVRFLSSLNMLQPRTNLVHSVKVDEGEMEMIRDVGAHIVHCPISNMYLASGVAPVTQYLKYGINVAAGSDGPASNNTQNMFETIKVTACQQRAVTEDADAVTVEQTIAIASSNGGLALGDSRIGILQEGAHADIVLLDTRAAHMRPYHNAGATIAYCAQASDVDTVFVNGRMLLRSKKPLFINEQELIDECERRIQAVLARSTYGTVQQ